MPNYANPARQEWWCSTSQPPYLVVFTPPLNHFSLTTIFLHPFPSYDSNYLQFLTKTLKFYDSNYSNMGWHLSTLRVYVASSRCKSGWSQFQSLFCCRPRHPALFSFLPPSVVEFFCIFWTPSIPTTRGAMILTLFEPLNWNYLPLLFVSMVLFFSGHFPKFLHRNRWYVDDQNPP